MSVVDIVGVSKRYETVVALDAVSLTFGEGEFFGLLGPSGSGKTTLLRAIAGFVQPDAGEIRFDGEDIRAKPVHRRDIGMVFQSYALFPHMTVFDNVAFGLTVRGQRSRQVKGEVERMLGLVRLSGLEARRPSQLSGGQQQRVALARALITRPRVLLLDEPLGALDKRLRQQMQIELRQIQREVGITTVFVTHDQEEALTLSDRIAIFDEGRAVQVGSPGEVYERPRTRFAANFLGDANFFAARLAGRTAGGARYRLEGGQEVAVALTPDLPPPESALLAVRPEKFALQGDGPPPPDGADTNRLRGVIRQSVYSGSSITYKLRLDGVAESEPDLTVFEQNRNARPFEPGEPVWVAWSAAHTVAVEP
ncbi:MAG: ABC transporter ATP-binding protein [Dongiaceae bacterium]